MVLGDKVKVHYRGTLESDGTQFDASYDRGNPLEFHVGKGQVIKGWDEGLLDMCIGVSSRSIVLLCTIFDLLQDKRTLTIQPEYGYGSRAMGPIPANSVLVFETELMGISGVQKEEL